MAVRVFKPDAKFKPKWYLITALIAVVSLAGTILMGFAIGNDAAGAEGARNGVIVAIVINLLWIVPTLALIPPYYRSLRYEIHDEEVIVYVGIITRSVKHVPFRTVTNLLVSRGPFDRIFGLGTLHIQTAGMSGKTGAEESLVGLANVQEVYEQVGSALRRYRSAMAPTQAEEEALPASGVTLTAILDELRAIRKALERSRGD